jgi:integrase
VELKDCEICGLGRGKSDRCQKLFELLAGEPTAHSLFGFPDTDDVESSVTDRAMVPKLIFTAPRGGPLRYQNFLSRVWHPTLLRLGLPAVGVHVLRHSAAARIVAAGGSAKTLQTVLGHRSASFSLTVYGHHFDADLDAPADRLDAMTAKHG